MPRWRIWTAAFRYVRSPIWLACVLMSNQVAIGHVVAREAHRSTADSDMPAGILLGDYQIGTKDVVIFENSASKPLYTYEKGVKHGKSADNGKDLKDFKPELALKGSRGFGMWTIVVGKDGARQWAFRGRPLYSYRHEVTPKDPDVGERRDSGRLPQPTAEGLHGCWHAAVLKPAQWVKMPSDFAVTESVMAPGQLLTTAGGLPVYGLIGGESATSKLSNQWRPYAAGMMELPVGRFTIQTQKDGSRQWAYRGLRLYTFSGDLQPGDLNGKDVNPHMSPVVLFHYFLPAQVRLQKDETIGGRLVVSKTDHTLYAHDRLFYDPASYNARGLNRGNPQTGRIIGTSGCDAECQRSWRPLLAPADAQSNGYWTVLTQQNGAKQWAYRGYALYTYSKEPPGSIYGSQMWRLNVTDSMELHKVSAKFGLGLFWRVAVP